MKPPAKQPAASSSWLFQAARFAHTSS